MRILVSTLLLLITLTAGAWASVEIPSISREYRGVWLSTVSNIDWPSRPGLPSRQQQEELIAILDRAQEMNLNMVLFQVRPAADAFYLSDIEPWSRWLTGQQGRAPGVPWDPLEFAVREAHARGLELHAWVNPFRAGTDNGPYSEKHVSRKHPELVVQYGKYLWINPTKEAAQQYVLRVIEDLLQRYEVDGIVFDDYFYPYPQNGIEFPDHGEYQRFKAGGGMLSHAEWRRERVNTFVRRAAEKTHQTRPSARFGISPFGIWRPGHPSGIVGMDPVNEIYADSRLWLTEGWVDWLAPQLYWRIDKDGQEFPKLLEWWAQQNPMNRHVVAGLGLYRLGEGSANNYEAQEVIDQLAIVRRTHGAHGEVHFPMNAIMENKLGVSKQMKKSHYNTPALLPPATWLDSRPPTGPLVSFDNNELSWRHPSLNDVRLWVVYAQTHGKWWIDIVPPQQQSLKLGSGKEPPDVIAVTAVDHLGNESSPAMVRP